MCSASLFGVLGWLQSIFNPSSLCADTIKVQSGAQLYIWHCLQQCSFTLCCEPQPTVGLQTQQKALLVERSPPEWQSSSNCSTKHQRELITRINRALELLAQAGICMEFQACMQQPKSPHAREKVFSQECSILSLGFIYRFCIESLLNPTPCSDQPAQPPQSV